MVIVSVGFKGLIILNLKVADPAELTVFELIEKTKLVMLAGVAPEKVAPIH